MGNHQWILSRKSTDLDNVSKWLMSNKLTLNTKKTEYMIIGSQNRLNNILSSPEVLIGDQKIERVKERKGISWCNHG